MNNNSSFKSERLLSLDALRGLDMFTLVGFAAIFQALPALSEKPAFAWLAGQFEHPEWHGFTVYDLIFPMFIFIVGAAMPFSFSRRMNEPGGKRKLFRHVVIRSLTLAILGAILWKVPGGAHPHYGFYSVLYRIGFSYFFAALIMLNTSIRGQYYWAFGLVLFHWLFVHFFPVPGYGMGDFSAEGNAGRYVSDLVSENISPKFKYVLSISLIPSISIALLGGLAGHWLMSANTGPVKAKGLLIAGLVLMASGFLIHLDIPINKNFHTASFTFLTCGITATLLAIFYWIIDVKNHKGWAFFFIVVGMNSITIYVLNSLFNFYTFANTFLGGFDFGDAKALVFALALATVKWLMLYYLYRQRIFLRI